jgi:glycerol-3-phosphate dehydrogenase
MADADASFDPLRREHILDALDAARQGSFDLLIVGGGATGLGIAIDASTRGLRVALLEAHDFGKGTSSRSTKLVHGGVRYLAQGNISLVRGALRERALLLNNAPHLVHPLRFIIPTQSRWETWYYTIGLKMYDALAGKRSFGRSVSLGRDETLQALPTLDPSDLSGGVAYWDGQFDDTRLLIAMARTAAAHGALLLNHAPVTQLIKENGRIVGVVVVDEETQRELRVLAKVVINATGPFTDRIRQLDNPQQPAMVAPSRGSHLVLDRDFLPGDTALMVPKTRDGRVLFAIPWHDKIVVGTTDVSTSDVSEEPTPDDDEVGFILETISNYLVKPPTRNDIRSVFAGIRPLVKADGMQRTASLSRDHTIRVDPSQLLTIAGGKWTTYRHMAEDAVDQAVKVAGLPARPCITHTLKLHGHCSNTDPHDLLAVYGSDADAIRSLAQARPGLAETLHPRLPYTAAEVIWAARYEWARTVEDVLSRRTRALLLDAQAAQQAAPKVVRLLAEELKRDEDWQRGQVESLNGLAMRYGAV